MIKIETAVTINKPADEVFAYISDFERNPEWQEGMVRCTFTTEPPLRIGSQYEQEAIFLMRKIISLFEVIDYDPGRMVKATTIASSFPITFTRIVDPAGEQAQVRAIVEGDASGFFRIMQPLLRRMVKRSVDRDYRYLKQLMEVD